MSNRIEKPDWTEPQDQYLAFIYTYTMIHGKPPTEADMQRFFRVTPPTVHRMVNELEKKKLIRKTPGAARSIQLLTSPDALPMIVPPSKP